MDKTKAKNVYMETIEKG